MSREKKLNTQLLEKTFAYKNFLKNVHVLVTVLAVYCLQKCELIEKYDFK